ncbi:hypothetical protein Agabi119p4_4453 [Agaricus bisporus var. burnettii]|uniref:C3H1-type domain-containing protein n=1 Tax=Agaricus bisporus var. burnettii TaxID=192524 RepID=A0A8H7F360_AGABI|nr:hypothetical protein Agabi119p4_4453 [Agaricus bisporus var. burnettii]
MAAQPLGEANKQLWDDTLTKLLNLSHATLQRNAELENRVAELEVELLVWKQAHSVALEASERDTKAHNMQLASLNRQISNMDSFKSNFNPLILCVINGDEFLFKQDLVVQGYQGGRVAAQIITQSIAEYLTNEDIHVFGRLSFWISIYFNRTALKESFIETNYCTPDQFDNFIAGFIHASPRFLAIDGGNSKDAAEAKIREYLQVYTRFPQTLRVFFGGYDATTYMSTFSVLEKEQAIGKVILLTASENGEREAPLHTLPQFKLDSVFTSDKLPRMNRNPQSPARSMGRLIDQSLPLHKQNPPPCNEHYLMTCSKGAALCKYAHDYVLTPEQLHSLATNAKKAPCNWLKNGMPCPFGDKCCWGHVCPNGAKCYHLSKGKCWFKGESMHPTSTTPSPVESS